MMKRPRRRRNCIGRRHKNTVKGDKYFKTDLNPGTRDVPAPAPALRPRTQPSHESVTLKTVKFGENNGVHAG